MDILRRILALTPDDQGELLGHLCAEFPETVQDVLDRWFLPPATATAATDRKG